MREFNGLPRDRMLDFDKDDILETMGDSTNCWEAYRNYIDYKLSECVDGERRDTFAGTSITIEATRTVPQKLYYEMLSRFKRAAGQENQYFGATSDEIMAHMKFVHACGDKRDKRYYTRLWALHFAVEHIVTNPYLAMPKFITDQ